MKLEVRIDDTFDLYYHATWISIAEDLREKLLLYAKKIVEHAVELVFAFAEAYLHEGYTRLFPCDTVRVYVYPIAGMGRMSPRAVFFISNCEVDLALTGPEDESEVTGLEELIRVITCVELAVRRTSVLVTELLQDVERFARSRSLDLGELLSAVYWSPPLHRTLRELGLKYTELVRGSSVLYEALRQLPPTLRAPIILGPGHLASMFEVVARLLTIVSEHARRLAQLLREMADILRRR